jgi:hypothetical protein
MATQTVLSTYAYPENDVYQGPAYKGVVTFRGLKGTQLVIKYLMEDLIIAKCKLADVTPLRAILKISQIKEDYLDYITDEYELTLYYHESPAIAGVIYAIAIAIAALGFLVIAWRSTATTWEKAASATQGLVELPTAIASSVKTLAIYSTILTALYFIYKAYGK